MDALQRPDIGEGIFFEYLRRDNPISKEFIERVVDGFPFLLSPIRSSLSSDMQRHRQEPLNRSSGIIGKIMGTAKTKMDDMAGMLHFVHWSISSLVDRVRRTQVMQEATSILSDGFRINEAGEVTKETGRKCLQQVNCDPTHDVRMLQQQSFHVPWDSSVLLVHLYLLLLFIVSFPGSHRKLVTRRKSSREVQAPRARKSSLFVFTGLDMSSNGTPSPMKKKSLSYFL